MEQALIIGIVLVAIFMVMVFTNVPISVALGGSTIVTMLLFGVSIDSYADLMVSGMRKFSYLAIPFFILSGILMDRSGVAARIIRFAKACIGHITGGLAIMSIVVSVFWGAISGAGPATVAALGGVLIPSMDEEGYDKGFAAAVVAAAGGISIIIPPSITFVIYGVLANVSIGDLFIAGVIPGLFMGLCFCIYAYIYCRKHGYHGSAKVQKGEVWKTFKEAFLGILSPVIILGDIYGGIFTPTEAAAISVFYSLILALFVYKTVSLKSLFKIYDHHRQRHGVLLVLHRKGHRPRSFQISGARLQQPCCRALHHAGHPAHRRVPHQRQLYFLHFRSHFPAHHQEHGAGSSVVRCLHVHGRCRRHDHSPRRREPVSGSQLRQDLPGQDLNVDPATGGRRSAGNDRRYAGAGAVHVAAQPDGQINFRRYT